MESESKEPEESDPMASFKSSGYKLPSDYKKYIRGEWFIDKRIKLAQEISHLRKLVPFLEFITLFKKEHDRVPSLEELKEKKFETFLISNWNAEDPFFRTMEVEKFLEMMRLQLNNKEKNLAEILVDAAVGMDESSLNDLVEKIKQCKEYKRKLNEDYTDPVLGKVAMVLIEFNINESRLPTQEELFERVGFFLTDKQKRRIKKAFGLVGVLPRKKRSQGFGGPQR